MKSFPRPPFHSLSPYFNKYTHVCYKSVHFIGSQSIYKFGVSVCLFVCLYPINVKTAEPIRPKFFVGHHVTPWKVYE